MGYLILFVGNRTACILHFIQQESPIWLELLKEFGLDAKSLDRLKHTIEKQIPDNHFPESVSTYSKQLRFPWGEPISFRVTSG